ncbi:MAG: glycosyltransferase [Candidatus Binatia bacterium]
MPESPFVSAIVPVRAVAAPLVVATLEALIAQDYPTDRLEVLVVGAEIERHADVMEAWAGRDPRVRWLGTAQGAAAALNLALQSARGDIICRVDAGTAIAPVYIRVGVEALERTGADGVHGRSEPRGGGWFGDAVAAAMRSPLSRRARTSAIEDGGTDGPARSIWRRAVFERYGMFDEELQRNEEDELRCRVGEGGGRLAFDAAMRSWYQNPQDVAYLVRECYQSGQWMVRVLQKHRGQVSWRHLAPPAFVAGLIALQLVGPVAPAAGVLSRAVAGGYLIALLIAAVKPSGRRGPAAVCATALAFACMHLAWGAGFLSGLIKHGDRWRKSAAPPPRLQQPGASGDRREPSAGADVPEAGGE